MKFVGFLIVICAFFFPAQGVSGMPNVRDHDASVYLKVQGDALHIGGYERDPVFWDEVDHDFAFGLFDLVSALGQQRL